MSDILIGHAYYLRHDPKSWEARQPYPPLGTLYAAAVLREAGHDVALFDAILAESEAEWAEALDRERPRIAIVYEDNFNYLSKMCLSRMRQAAFAMFEMARARGCTVIAAGSDATDNADAFLAAGADYVIIGEGERTLEELVARLAAGDAGTPDDVAGLAFGSTRTPPRLAMRELDALPLPARDLLDIDRYRDIWQRHHGHFSINLVTTRGCPYHCNWCAKPIWGQRYNVRSPEDVVAELDAVRAAYAPDHIWFADDIFGLKPGWLSRFADLVEARGAPIPFKCLSRADLLLRDGDIDALRRAGCDIVWIGAESGSQKVLDAMEKGTRVEQIEQAAARLHEAGLRVGFFLQFGYPGESRADIARTFRMVRRCRPDDIGMSVSYPLPGTKFYRSVESGLGEKRNWEDAADLAMMYSGPFSTAFYRRLHGVLHNEFRMRRGWRRFGSALREPSTLSRPALGAGLRALYHTAALPLGRLRLEWLARAPHRPTTVSLRTLPHVDAAQPSSQDAS